MADSSATDFLLNLSSDADAAGVARKFVDEHSDSLPVELIEDAKLLVSELVTNAVLHGRPDITLRVSLEPPLMGVSVQDQGAVVPTTDVLPPTLDASGGRGLMIVDRLSSDWGIVPSDPAPGKTIWFRLDAPTPS